MLRALISGLALALVAVAVGADGARSTAVAAVPTEPVKIPLGAKPAWVAFDPTTGRAYVTNSAGGTVSVVDLAAGSVTRGVMLEAGTHARIHTNEYYRTVNNLLSGAESRDDVIAALGHIRQGIQGGSLR